MVVYLVQNYSIYIHTFFVHIHTFYIHIHAFLHSRFLHSHFLYSRFFSFTLFTFTLFTFTLFYIHAFLYSRSSLFTHSLFTLFSNFKFPDLENSVLPFLKRSTFSKIFNLWSSPSFRHSFPANSPIPRHLWQKQLHEFNKMEGVNDFEPWVEFFQQWST